MRHQGYNSAFDAPVRNNRRFVTKCHQALQQVEDVSKKAHHKFLSSLISLSGTDGTDGTGGKATLFGNKIPIGTKPPDFQL
jgi:hypothetical protein